MNPLLQVGGAPPASGALLAGRYRLGRRCGAGGMATVYRGRDEVLDRDVAVKVLHPHLARDEALRRRFKAEARSAARLDSPHVVRVFDEGVDGLPFIVLEYVDGPSLREVLAVRTLLPAAEALAVLEPVCDALARAHAVGLVHRDLKPDNVLVGGDGTVKVADFGLARVLDSTKVTDSGQVLGSIDYVAPEVILGAEASPASDQYAVGVLLFELLTGRRPLAASSPDVVALRHLREAVPHPSAFVAGLPPAVDAVVARATARAPADRYRDLAAFLAALRRGVPGGPHPVAVPRGATGTARVLPPPPRPDLGPLPRVQRRVPTRRRRRAARRPRAAIALRTLALALLAVLLWDAGALGGGGGSGVGGGGGKVVATGRGARTAAPAQPAGPRPAPAPAPEAVAGLGPAVALAAPLDPPPPPPAVQTGGAPPPAPGLAGAYAAAVLRDHPVLYYRFNETSGTAATAAAGGDGAYRQPGLTLRTPGPLGDGDTAITLDGSGGYVTSPTPVTNPTALSVEIWFRTTTARGGRLIGFSQDPTGTSTTYDRHLFMSDAGTLVFSVAPGGVDPQSIVSPGAYHDGRWHLAVATLGRGGMALYVDGEPVAGDAATTTAEDFTGYWRVGYDSLRFHPQAPVSESFAGSLDEAAVYPYALSPDQVRAHFDAGT